MITISVVDDNDEVQDTFELSSLQAVEDLSEQLPTGWEVVIHDDEEG